MLVVREGKRLEVEDIGDAEQAIEPDTEGMSRELGVEARRRVPRKLWAWLVSTWNWSASWLLTVSMSWRRCACRWQNASEGRARWLLRGTVTR